jgi:hypothetical protein
MASLLCLFSSSRWSKQFLEYKRFLSQKVLVFLVKLYCIFKNEKCVGAFWRHEIVRSSMILILDSVLSCTWHLKVLLVPCINICPLSPISNDALKTYSVHTRLSFRGYILVPTMGANWYFYCYHGLCCYSVSSMQLIRART